MEDANTGSDPLLQVIATPSNSHAWSRSSFHSHILFSVKTGIATTDLSSKRAPLNLAIVLDRSGSMQTEAKLENAKLAIIQVIEHLSTDDILHLLVYGDDTDVIFENASVSNSAKLISQVKTIRTTGCTNLWSGVEKGAELIGKYSKPGYTARMFLFSDGQVNKGLQDKTKIQEQIAKDVYSIQKIKVSSFGLGSDFDEALMRGIAECGGGTYFFIDGSEAIPMFVNSALSNLINMVALDAVLHVRSAHDNVSIDKIYGHGEISQGAHLGDLHQNNTRTVVIGIKVGDTGHEGLVKVVEWQLDYGTVTRSATDVSQPQTINGTVSLNFTEDGEAIGNGENAEVQIKVVLQQSAEMDLELVKLVDAHQKDDAQNLAKKQIELLESVEHLDKDGKFRIAAELKQAREALGQLTTDTKAFRKKADHRGYRKRHASEDYDDNFL